MRFNISAPNMLPSERDPWPLTSAVREVASSGKDVPSAIK